MLYFRNRQAEKLKLRNHWLLHAQSRWKEVAGDVISTLEQIRKHRPDMIICVAMEGLKTPWPTDCDFLVLYNPSSKLFYQLLAEGWISC